MNNDLISREDLKKVFKECIGDSDNLLYAHTIYSIIDNAPVSKEQTPGNCKTCKYYHPYYQMFSTETRGDGFCTIARLTSEGFLYINCKDDFYCSYYTKGNEE